MKKLILSIVGVLLLTAVPGLVAAQEEVAAEEMKKIQEDVFALILARYGKQIHITLALRACGSKKFAGKIDPELFDMMQARDVVEYTRKSKLSGTEYNMFYLGIENMLAAYRAGWGRAFEAVHYAHLSDKEKEALRKAVTMEAVKYVK